MKILHIIDSGGLYGTEVMLLNLMSAQVSMGLKPILASIGDTGVGEKPLEAEAIRRGLSVKVFRMCPGPNVRGALKVLRFARSEQVDLLHSHGYKGNILIGLMPRILRRIPMIATLHGWTWTGGISRMFFYEWLDGVSLRSIDRVVLVNQSMREHPRLKRQPQLELAVVHNGIPRETSSGADGESGELDREILDFCHQGFTIGAIGRLSPEKGFDVLLEAVAGLVADGEAVQLLLLGEGGLRRSLEEKAQKLGLEKRVYMPGYVYNARNYLPLIKLYAMPSLTEGLPIVLLEAMQAGVPIVASKVGGIPYVLENGQAGLLIEPGNVSSLKEGLCEVIRNREAAGQRTLVAQQLVHNQYSSQIMATKYLEIYGQVVERSLLCHATR